MNLLVLAVVLATAKLSGDLAARWGQPPVLGQLGAGLVLGVASFLTGEALPLGEANAALQQTADLGVVLLMFLAGLETDWEQMRQTGRAAFSSAVVGGALPLAGGGGVAMAFGLAPRDALFVGVI